MKGFYISAAHKSSGKTTVSIGLSAALHARGSALQTFKKGPDYIDPMWLSLASEKPCYNLDFYTQSEEEILNLLGYKSAANELCLVEGNKGLYDGLDLHGSNSNAAMAKFLKLPVVLVLDTVGTIRGLAPLVLGYQAFDPDVEIAGVILNKVGGPRHEKKLIQVMETYTDVPVLGAVGRGETVKLLERHLGLIPSNEEALAKEKVAEIGRVISESVDLDRLVDLSKPVNKTPESSLPIVLTSDSGPRLRIGVAKDAAFGFYYADDLEKIRRLGGDIVYIDLIEDSQLPTDLDGLVIGGGFPESFLQELSENKSMLSSVKAASEGGLPIYAECGGLMYLAQSLEYEGIEKPLVGIVPSKCVMTPKPVGRGYTDLTVRDSSFWGHQEKSIKAHEFHYSKLVDTDGDLDCVYTVNRGYGIDGARDGFRYKNTLASYTHMRDTEGYPWCEKFMEFVNKIRTL